MDDQKMSAYTSSRSVRLSAEEAWEVIISAHTAVMTTLRRDGVPISLPTWFVVESRNILCRSPLAAKRISRIEHDPRASFLVEDGVSWANLRAVHLTGRAEIDPDKALYEHVAALLERKYAGLRTEAKDMRPETRRHYDGTRVVVRFLPDERILSWDNSRLSAGGGGSE